MHLGFACFALNLVILGMAETSPAAAQDAIPASPPSASAASADENSVRSPREWSGMYSFRKEGEFVQLSVEEQGQVSGFVSRYGDGASDKGAFLDQFFKKAKLDDNKLSFTTEVVHGVWFDFQGTIERGAGKTVNDEGYYVLKGTLTQSSSDAEKKVSTRVEAVTLKMFPQDAMARPRENPSPRN
ncbi:MAG TPA: hypothetical protein VI386_16835 [Candidatus Sulfotelmatobacter sp.]